MSLFEKIKKLFYTKPKTEDTTLEEDIDYPKLNKKYAKEDINSGKILYRSDEEDKLPLPKFSKYKEKKWE